MHLVTSCYSAPSHPRADLSGKENKLGIIKQTKEKENGTERYKFGTEITVLFARVLYTIGLPHGSLTVFPAGTRQFLSAGCRRFRDGITRAGSIWYPYGSRLIFISGEPYGYHVGPGWVIPSGTRLYPEDKYRRVPTGNTRAP